MRRIRVTEARSPGLPDAYFTAGIYSNTSSGLPGKVIVSSTGTAASTCGPVTVHIAATRLKRNTIYWIEETAGGDGQSEPALFYWEANPTAKRKAYVQTYRNFVSSSGFHSSSTSPWTKQMMGPYFKLK